MDLPKFLVFVYDGAFSVFEQIILDLSKSDLKSLRLVIKSLSDPLFPYMFDRLFLSLHDSDLDVFTRLVNDPRVCRNITDLCWDDAFYEPYASGEIISDSTKPCSHTHLSAQMQTYKNLAALPPTRDYNLLLHRAPVTRFWKAHDEHVKDNQEILEAGVDSMALKNSFGKLPNLRQIEMLSPLRPTVFEPQSLQHIWDSPRVRDWSVSSLTGQSVHPGPGVLLPRIEPVRGFRSMLHLCKEMLSIESIEVQFVNPYRLPAVQGSSGSLLRPLQSPGQTRKNGAVRLRSSVPEADRLKGLTLRFLVEVPSASSAGTVSMLWLLNFDRLLSTSKESLQRLTMYRVCLDSFMSHLLEYQHYNALHPLTSCVMLRSIQFSTTSCECMFAFFCWISKNTKIREIELSEVHSIGESWQSVMTRMKQQEILFDAFEMIACRSRSHQRTFGPSISAPWHGKSSKVVPWLKSETDEFPLWQSCD